MKKVYVPVFALCLVFMAFQCEDDIHLTQEQEALELNTLKQTIDDLASQPLCNESTECNYIAFGSKPCGGPWVYLIYSTAIDEEKLIMLVEEYNQKQDAFNKKWDVVSDCSVALPPTNINCENNTCIAVYQN